MIINVGTRIKVTRVCIIILIVVSTLSVKMQAQVAGSNTYDFLNLTNSARIAAMGGDFLPIYDGDITLAITNPSIIDSTMHNHLALSIVDYYSDINYGFASYSRFYEKYGSFVASVQFVDYGKFLYANDAGNIQGNFTASEMALQLGWGRMLSPVLSVGSNLKFIYSAFESYLSYGIAMDVAATYHNEDTGLASSLIIKNIGRQVKAYRSGNNERLPFEIQFGVSKTLTHLPFRYSVLVNHLSNWDLTYPEFYDANDFLLVNEQINGRKGLSKFGDQLMRHVVIGGELLLSENFILRIGYNYRRRQELAVDVKSSTIGFSWGFEFKISKFRLSYARSTYHLAGSPNYITITTRLSDFIQ